MTDETKATTPMSSEALAAAAQIADHFGLHRKVPWIALVISKAIEAARENPRDKK